MWGVLDQVDEDFSKRTMKTKDGRWFGWKGKGGGGMRTEERNVTRGEALKRCL